MLACPWNTLVLNGKGEAHKKSQGCVCVCVCVCVVVMVTALPARQGAQQPEHLAVSKGTSCGQDSATDTQMGISRRFLLQRLPKQPL